MKLYLLLKFISFKTLKTFERSIVLGALPYLFLELLVMHVYFSIYLKDLLIMRREQHILL